MVTGLWDLSWAHWRTWCQHRQRWSAPKNHLPSGDSLPRRGGHAGSGSGREDTALDALAPFTQIQRTRLGPRRNLWSWQALVQGWGAARLPICMYFSLLIISKDFSLRDHPEKISSTQNPFCLPSGNQNSDTCERIAGKMEKNCFILLFYFMIFYFFRDAPVA